MRYLSLFSGVGGFELAIQRATPESTCIGYSEIDKYAIETYEHNWKGHNNYGDATTIEPAGLPDFDLLVGGFPCQAFSIAGKRAGFNDIRGTLFFDIARILKDKRPRHLLLENVKGLLSHDEGKTFQTILRVLADLGYRVEWQILNAKYHGVPQNRERVFVIGHLGRECGRQVFPIGQDGEEASELSGHYANTLTRRYEGAQATGSYIGEGKLDAQEINQLNKPTHSNDRVYGDSGISPTLNSAQGGNRQPFVTKSVAIRTRAYDDQPAKLEVRSDKLSNTVNTVTKDFMAMQWRRSEKGKKARRQNQKKGHDYTPFSDEHRELAPHPTKPVGAITSQAVAKDSLLGDGMRIRRLTPTECERLMSWPDGWTIGSDTQRYKQCGNGVVSNCVQAVVEKMISEGCI